MSTELESDMCCCVYDWQHLVKATRNHRPGRK